MNKSNGVFYCIYSLLDMGHSVPSIASRIDNEPLLWPDKLGHYIPASKENIDLVTKALEEYLEQQEIINEAKALDPNYKEPESDCMKEDSHKNHPLNLAGWWTPPLVNKPKNQPQKTEKTVKSAHTKEKNSMLKIIIAMAMAKYGYDPLSDNNKVVTGENKGSIHADLPEAISLSSDTIKKFLNEAKDLYLENYHKSTH